MKCLIPTLLFNDCRYWAIIYFWLSNDNLWSLFTLDLVWNNAISDQIYIDFSAENGRKLPVAAAKTCCNILSAITEWSVNLWYLCIQYLNSKFYKLPQLLIVKSIAINHCLFWSVLCIVTGWSIYSHQHQVIQPVRGLFTPFALICVYLSMLSKTSC